MKKWLKPLLLLDVDDILFSCNDYAVKLANEKFNIQPPLTINELKTWGGNNGRADIILEFYKKKEFFETQPVIDGAYDFLKILCEKVNVVIATAVPPEFMGIRIKRVLNEFPFFPKENIIMCQRKDLIQADITFDDGMHNVLNSLATYPVLMRKPWNQKMTGTLAVNNYQEFLSLLDHVILQNGPTFSDYQTKFSKIYCLIGPTGSDKNNFTDYMLKCTDFERPISYTTRKIRKDEIGCKKHYKHISNEEFCKLEDQKFFHEITSYANEKYGTSIDAVSDVIRHHNAIMPIDICGAVSLQEKFPDRTVFVYLKKPKEEIVRHILKQDIPEDEKAIRLLSIEREKRNEELCDIVISSTGNYKKMKGEMLKEAKGLL